MLQVDASRKNSSKNLIRNIAKNVNTTDDLSLDVAFVHQSTVALIREYFARKGFRKTLESFDDELPKSDSDLNISSRSKLISYLGIQRLYELNKKLETPFKTIIELLISFHSANFEGDSNGGKSDNMESNYYSRSKLKSNQHDMLATTLKSQVNDLTVDDADEGELHDGFDKRIRSSDRDENPDLPFKLTSKMSLDDRPVKKSIAKSKTTPVSELETTCLLVSSAAFNDKNQINNEKSDSCFSNKPKKSNDEKQQHEKSLIEPTGRKELPQSMVEFDSSEIVDFSSKLNRISGLTKSTLQKVQSNALQSDTSKHTRSSKSSPLVATQDYSTRQIDFETAKRLRMLLFGCLNQTFSNEWKIQNFAFCDLSRLKFGIVQKKGGSCGVLASVQAYVLRELIFGSDDPTKDSNAIFNPSKRMRSIALAKGLARLIWKCGLDSGEAIIACASAIAYFAPTGKYKSDGVTESINLLTFRAFESLESYMLKHVDLYEAEGTSSCILLLYSAILTRSIEQIELDMDDKANKLMGKHDYCTQEMVNLLIHGRAVSNVFNDTVYLDKLELRGINKRNEIGLLSLFEHYKSCEVGSYYKTPKYPLWLVCSESHFSILFALRRDILNDWKAESRFDIFYYDGLAKQDESIKLTISSKDYDQDSFMSTLYRNKKAAEKELIPPLEMVIRTKWKNAAIDWNSTEPIL